MLDTSLSRNEQYSFFRENMYDVLGRMRSNSLFWETRANTKEDYTPLFTLKDNDIVRDDVLYYSLKKIYLSYDHVPFFEYEFALDVLGSWNYWVFLSTKSALRATFKQWQEELEIRNKANALRAIMESSKGSSASAVLASKYLADKGWEAKAGRPSKEEKQRHLKQEEKINESLAQDMERLGLSVVGAK